jgi:hypothetical protein
VLVGHFQPLPPENRIFFSATSAQKTHVFQPLPLKKGTFFSHFHLVFQPLPPEKRTFFSHFHLKNAIFSATSHMKNARNGEGFVDDVTLWETSHTKELEDVLAIMETKAQAWEQGVHVAGGALNFLKTFFFAVSWNFRKNGQPVMQTVNDDPDIAINLTQGNERT